MNATNDQPELTHLIALLDDPDDAVALVVWDRLMDMGLPVAGMLRKVLHKSNNRTLTHRLARLISDMEMDHSYEALYAWSRERDPNMLKGLCLILRLVCPDLSFEYIFDAVFDISKEAWIELSDQKTTIEQIHLFNHIFYHRVGFRVDDPFLMDPNMAFLDKAIETKRANPVLFGLLYLAAANQAGIPITAVAFPGGFLPACTHADGRISFYINICQYGEIFGKEQLLGIFHNFGISMSEEQFFTCDTPALAAIYAESLYFIAGNTGDNDMERRMEKVLKLFGDKRILLLELEEEDG